MDDMPHSTEDVAPIDDLVARCCAGDTAAVTEMVTRYAPFVYRACLMVLQQPEDAEDAMQESLVKAVRGLGAYSHKDEAGFRGWLHRIALNTSISRLRRHSLPQVEWEALETMPSLDHDPEAAALQRIEQSRVMAALARLGEGHRLVVVLRYYHGLSCEEIADLLDLPPGTIGSRLFTARQRLRALLAEPTVTDSARKEAVEYAVP
ncbi:MAG: sigma-70 family RNA polymerase sigma factor [Anaerolineae bacterium]